MRYGNFTHPAPDFSKEVMALKDLLEKGEITETEFTKKKEYFKKIRLAYIIGTNGGYTKSTRHNRVAKRNLNQLKDEHLANRTMNFREQLLQAEQALPPGPEELGSESDPTT